LTFHKGASYHIRIEYQAYNMFERQANVDTVNSQIMLFWNLVAPGGAAVEQAVQLASGADVVILAVGASWNSDGEGADRSTLGLAPSQDALARAVFALGKPVIMVLEGGRPFAIPEWYDASAAVVNAFFPGQAGGRAVVDVLMGDFNPGGRLPISVPRDVGQLPVYYNYKPSAHFVDYTDAESYPYYPFGHGLSYTTFQTSNFRASVQTGGGSPKRAAADASTFASGDILTFSVEVANNGSVAGSYTAQVYLLGRVSKIVQPVRQLVAFSRVYVDAGATATATMEVEVDRYISMLNRDYQWELEKGSYTFALLEDGGHTADTTTNVSLQVV
jgi:hypothetical protein